MVLVFPQSHLRSAGDGERLACAIVETLRSDQCVYLDLANVESMTPSYANTLVMTVLHAMDTNELPSRIQLKNLCEPVSHAIQRAVQRYQSGIRLSTQRVPQARSA
jgi:hypothetical protein